MSYDNRNWVHNWDFKKPVSKCKTCHVVDMVEVCSAHHEVGCNCVNPPCPPSKEEMAANTKAVTDALGALVVPQSTTYDTLKTIIERYTGKGTPPPYTNTSNVVRSPAGFSPIRLSADITVMDEQRDLLTRQLIYYCRCDRHGNFVLKMADPPVTLAPNATRDFVVARLVHGCTQCENQKMLDAAQKAHEMAQLKGGELKFARNYVVQADMAATINPCGEITLPVPEPPNDS